MAAALVGAALHGMACSAEDLRVVVVGGGVCGVTCCQALVAGGQAKCVTLVAAAGLLKGAANVVRLSRHLDSFDVVEQAFDDVAGPHTTVVAGEASALDAANKVLKLRDGRVLPYDKLCICTGASPKIVGRHPRVLTLRDTASAQQLRQKLRDCRRVVIAGNGGIAMELVHEINNCEVVWAVREGHMGNAFFDADASQFLAPALASRLCPSLHDPLAAPRVPLQPSMDKDSSMQAADVSVSGSSLGPQWMHAALGLEYRESRPRSKHGSGLLSGASTDPASGSDGPATAGGATFADKCTSPVYLETFAEVVSIDDGGGQSGDTGWPVVVTFADGRVYGADYVISAIGVHHPKSLSSDLARSESGAILVDEHMRTSVADVFAAGDACHVQLKGGEEEQRAWFQMRLWSQARAQGLWAAHCILGTQDIAASPMEIFAHATYFFGYKVVLLGRFNGQGLDKTDPAFTELVRTTPDREYVKAVLYNGRLQGALLLGDTDLEETFENLILNQFDLSFLGDRLLDPEFDLEDFFD